MDMHQTLKTQCDKQQRTQPPICHSNIANKFIVVELFPAGIFQCYYSLRSMMQTAHCWN
eukprot:TRINITY_DN7748_c0_g1_i1.p3 TRINITY_DN7748_c0_g1~~TRINITY_DN7748_c0_g1_i1.p3  ORF type:complete len:59 (+),score=2.38 TRINITY_DN7748_c0_g1_i1:149-325(+)